jgi:Tol biopolymer transport system component
MIRIKNFKIFAGIMLVLSVAALACGRLYVEVNYPEENQTAIEDAVSATLTSLPLSPTPEPTAVQASWMESAELAPYTLPVGLAGLVYRQNNQIWVVNESGFPVLAADETYAAQISPDLTQMVYIDAIYEAEDLVLRDLNTGAEERLTDTPTILEGAMQWWPARPGVLVFNQTPEEQLGPWAGYLGAFDLENNQRMDLDMQSSSYSGFALSPDGRAILYDDAGNPLMYLWGEGISRLNMPGYGLDYESYAAPAWSPDGKTAAFYASRRGTEGATECAIVLVDLEAGQAREMHMHRSYGQRGGPEIAFSPDGRWLAVVNPGEDETVQNGPMALWVLAVDGSEEYYLGYSTGPVWSPDGGQLLFTQWPAPGSGGGSFQEDAHITLTEAGEWSLQEISPLVGSTLLSWHELP